MKERFERVVVFVDYYIDKLKSVIEQNGGIDVYKRQIMGLEEEFDIEIPNEEAEKIVTVGDAVEQIKSALN